MRKIVSNVNSPFTYIIKWLVKKLKKFGTFCCFAVKNNIDFVDKVKEIEIEDDDDVSIISN